MWPQQMSLDFSSASLCTRLLKSVHPLARPALGTPAGILSRTATESASSLPAGRSSDPRFSLNLEFPAPDTRACVHAHAHTHAPCRPSLPHVSLQHFSLYRILVTHTSLPMCAVSVPPLAPAQASSARLAHCGGPRAQPSAWHTGDAQVMAAEFLV